MASCLPVGRADVPRSSDVSAGRSWSREVKEGEGEYSLWSMHVHVLYH